MYKKILLAFSLMSFGLAATSQVTSYPWTEDLEGTTVTSGGCTAIISLSGSAFINASGDNQDWLPDNFGTPSSTTGPTINGGADHNPGTSGGKYLFLETSGCNGNTANLESPQFNLTSLTNPYLTFWYHMFGATMGTMHFDIDTNGTWINDYIPSWTDNQDVWQEKTVSLLPFLGQPDFKFRIRGITGSSFTSDMAVDDFRVFDAVFSTSADVQNPLCAGDLNGSISLTTYYNLGPVAYNWSSGQTTSAITNIGAGTYIVTVSDSAGSSLVDTFLLEEFPIVTTTTVLDDPVCSYDYGVAAVSATGGTPITASYLMDTSSANYSIDMTPGTLVSLSDDQVSAAFDIGFDFVFFGDTFSQFKIVSNGFIQFDLSTASGCCSGQILPNSAQPNAVVALAWEDLNPSSGAAGTISYVTVGTAPFQTLVVTFDEVPFFGSTVDKVSGQIKLHQTTNCVEILTIDVVNGGSGFAVTQGIENLSGTEGYTYPGRNSTNWSGSGDYISFCPPVGGFAYEWSNGITDTLNAGLAPGTMYVTVTDNNNCMAIDSVEISAPISDLAVSPVLSDVSCFGFNDGSIITNAANGVMPYVYNWSDGSTGADITGSGPGTYSLTVTDGVGCVDSSISSFNIWEPTLLVSTVNGLTNSTCPDAQNGSASVVAFGGQPPYSYSWTPGGLNGNAVTGLNAGSYQVVITDSAGCNSINSVVVLSDYPTPMPDLGPDLFSNNGAAYTLNAGSFTSYLWSNGSTNSTLNVTTSGTYWVEVTNEGGCAGSDTVEVEIWALGVEELGAEAIELAMYPNPVKDNLIVSISNEISEKLNFEIINMNGQVVQSKLSNSTNRLEFNTSDLAAGVYSMKITGDNVLAIKSFVKE